MWTDTEDNAISKVHTTVERTDSGITSPSHHSVQSMEIDTTDMPVSPHNKYFEFFQLIFIFVTRLMINYQVMI